MTNRRFYLSCIAISFFAFGIYGVVRYFFPLEFTTPETMKAGLRSGVIDVLFASCMAWDAWRAQRNSSSKNARAVPIIYPKTEAAIYGVGTLIVLAGIGFFAKLSLDLDQYTDGFTRARDIVVIVIGLAVAVRLLQTSWRALRAARLQKSEAGQEPFTLP